MLARTIRALVIAATAALVVAPTASALPANLTSANQANRLLSASWMLPAGASAWEFQASVDTTFEFESLRLFEELVETDVSFTATQPLPGGTYYVRIVTTPTLNECNTGSPSCTLRVLQLHPGHDPQPGRDAADGDAGRWRGGGHMDTVFRGGGLGRGDLHQHQANDFGFLDAVRYEPLDADQTGFTAGAALSPGTYYVHVITTPTPDLCNNGDTACVFEFSNIGAVTVPGPSSPPPPPPPPPPPAPARRQGAVARRRDGVVHAGRRQARASRSMPGRRSAPSCPAR